MAVLVTMELEASADEYDRLNDHVNEKLGSPDGLMLHTATDLGGKMRVVDVWESPEKFAKFGEEQLGPMVAEVMGDDGPTPSEPDIQELHNLEVHQTT